MNFVCVIGLFLANFADITWAGDRWATFKGSSFLVISQKVSQLEGQNLCIEKGANLAEIFSEQENNYVRKILSTSSKLSKGGWMGLTNLTGNGFRWINGQSPVFEAWAIGEPKEDKIDRACTFIYKGKWKTARCTETKEVICKRPDGLVTPKTNPVSSYTPHYCPSGYTRAGEKCFKIFRSSLADGSTVSWDEALSRCRQEPGSRPDLASIHSALENAYLTAQLNNEYVPLWIGMSRDNITTSWSDESAVVYTNMEVRKTLGYCVAMGAAALSTIGEWNWNDCGSKMNYICQTHKDGTNSIPPPTPPPVCKEGFHFYRGNCYKFMMTPSTWAGANELCRKQGAQLAAIHSQQENAALQVIVQGKPAWIGLHKSGGGQYEWSNGWYLLFTNWGKDEHVNNGGCVQMLDEGKWANKPCDRKQGFLCEISTGPPITTPAHLEGRCPPEGGWVPFGSHCFLFKPMRDTWMNAFMNCKKEDPSASIASIHSVTENDWIYKQHLRRTSLQPSTFWIGLHRSQKDHLYRWDDGSTIQYTNWARNHPTQNGHCVVINSEKGDSLWKDVDCESKEGYACKIEKRSNPTPPTEGPGKCPSSDWTSYGSSCFLFKPDIPMHWQAAKAFCVIEGGHLSSLRGQDEQDFIFSSMLANTQQWYSPYWLGAIREAEEQSIKALKLIWIDGADMNYTYWGRTYPNKDKDAECVGVDPDSGVWKNIKCDLSAGFVCRTDKLQPTEVALTTKLHDKRMLEGVTAALVLCIIVILILVVVLVLTVLRYEKMRDDSRTRTRHENKLKDPMKDENVTQKLILRCD